jgi:hypothetical protein
MTRSLFVLSIAAVAGACASAPSGAHRASCVLAPGDSVFLIGGPAYRDCAVEHRAVVVDRSANPEFRPSSPPPGGRACYSAEVEFVVDPAGAPETGHAIVLHTNNPEFAQAFVAALARWRYRPATIQGVPVRQIVIEKQAIAEVVTAVRMGETPRPPNRMPTC